MGGFISKIFKAYKLTLSIYKKDKTIILYSLVPLIIGIFLYYFLGVWAYEYSSSFIDNVSSGIFGSIFKWVFIIIYLYLINLTFVFIVNLISCPFLDIISQKVESVYSGSRALDTCSISKIGIIFITEIKKILFILLISCIFLLFGYIPLLSILSFLGFSILFTIEFIDYSWSRKKLTFSQCFKNTKSNYLIYTVAGVLFLLVNTIPIINLIIPSFGVSYFTVLYLELEI